MFTVSMPRDMLRKFVSNACVAAEMPDDLTARLMDVADSAPVVLAGEFDLPEDGITCGCPLTEAGLYAGAFNPLAGHREWDFTDDRLNDLVFAPYPTQGRTVRGMAFAGAFDGAVLSAVSGAWRSAVAKDKTLLSCDSGTADRPYVAQIEVVG